MSTAVQKWENSLGVRIPHDVARQVRLTEGTRSTCCRGGRIVVHPVTVPTLAELLARVPRGKRPKLVDWGRPVGK